MKKILMVLGLLFFVVASCKKETATTNAPLTKTQFLSNNAWQVKELIQQSGNTQGKYIKGGINTTGADYSKARLIFMTNGTGSFTDPLNHTYTLTWSFMPGDETKMNLLINYPTPVTLNYSFVTLDKNNFTYTIYYTEAGQNALATVNYIPL
jgi:hypothetical protein